MKTLNIPAPINQWVQKMEDKVASDSTKTLYDRYEKRVFHKCLQMTKSEADAHDLSQEIWIKVQKNILDFNNKSSYSTWIHSITFNHCIDFLRRKNRLIKQRSNYETEQEDSVSPLHFELKHQREQQQFLLERVKSLAQEEKMKILWMKYGKNMSVKEISAALNLTVSAVKMRLQRARLSMRKEIERQFPMAC